MRSCALSNLTTPFVGKIVNAPKVRSVNKDHAGTVRSIGDINKVAAWISNLGWNVIFERKGETGVTPALRNVVIDSSTSRDTQLYSILHEAGHILTFEDKSYLERFPDGYVRYAGKRSKRTDIHKFDVLVEEVTAWQKAEDIAKHLGISVNKRNFNLERNKSLKTYTDWIG
jgi:hypothetical protein